MKRPPRVASNLGAFYARRVRRLMPAGLVVVAATLLLGAIFLPPASNEQLSLARTAIAFAYFGSNFFFFRTTGGYFDAPSFSLPLLHTWSLAVEEQYYLIWPLIMLLIFRFSGSRRTEGLMRTRSMWVLGIMLVASLALSIGTTRDHQNFAFFLLPARIWEFAIGGMVGLAGTAFYTRLRPWAEGLAVAGLALIVYSVVALDHATPFPGWVAIFPVLGSALLIAGTTADEDGFVRRILALKPMVFIGLLSYSWYLWHWPLLSLLQDLQPGCSGRGSQRGDYCAGTGSGLADLCLDRESDPRSAAGALSQRPADIVCRARDCSGHCVDGQRFESMAQLSENFGHSPSSRDSP